MTHPFQWFSLLLIALFVTSCSKTNDTQLSGCSLESLKEVFAGATQASFFYTYDNQGRVSRIDFDSKSSGRYEIYTYSSDKIAVSGTANSNGTAVYDLDASGRVIKYGSTTFSYNSDGYLERAVDAGGPFPVTINYSYQNGNLVRLHEEGSNGGPLPLNISVLYEFDLTQPSSTVPPGDPINFTATHRPVLGRYFGKGSANLVKKETIKMAGFPDEIRTHTYTHDTKGNITVVRTATPGGTGEKQLAYTCK
jgi:hypothetical protein